MAESVLGSAYRSSAQAAGMSAAPDTQVDTALDAAFEAGAERWPRFTLTPEQFGGYLGARVKVDQLVALSREEAAELYLLAACHADLPEAIRAVDKTYFEEVPLALARFALPDATVRDIQQSLRAKLLVKDQRDALLHRYVGGGSLRGLIRVSACRMAISTLRDQKRQDMDSDLLSQAVDLADSPELSVLKARYRREFKDAFEASLEQLSVRERNLLRLHIVEGVTLAQLARTYRVDRSTVVRWLSQARSAVFDHTMQRLAQQLSLPAEDLRGLLSLVQSQLDLSLPRLLEK